MPRTLTNGSDKMKTEYSGIEIAYDEGRNMWLFELRGRSRSTESLAKAKEAIDKEPAEKRKPFPKFQAYKWSYNGWCVVSVTSVAEETAYGGCTRFWTSDENGRRSKDRADVLFPLNDHNTGLVEQTRTKEREQERIGLEISELRSQMQKASIPAGIA